MAPTGTNHLRLWQLLVPQIALVLCFLSPWIVTQQTTGFAALSKSERRSYCLQSFLICNVEVWEQRIPLGNTPERQLVHDKQSLFLDIGILALVPLTIIVGRLCHWHTDFIRTADRWRPDRVLWLSGVLAVIACASVQVICLLAHQWNLRLFEHLNQLLVGLREQNSHSPAAVGLFLVGAPIIEELFFRAGVQRLLYRFTTRRIAILGSSLAFALCHWLSPWHSVFTFFAGLWLATIYDRTGKLYVPIVSHVIGNVIAAVMLLY